MHIVQRVLPVALLALPLLACGAPVEGDEVKKVSVETEEEKSVYALGLAMAQNVEQFGLSEAEVELVLAAVADAALKREPQVSLAEYGPKLQQFVEKRMGLAADAEKAESEEFLGEMAATEGAEKTESGLIYIEMTAGEGASPTAEDTVEVHYHGTLRDGTVFDSSVDRGQPATFPLGNVIACWTEGVQKMKVGGKSKLVCPASIAYGDRGAPPKIKPGAALVFEVELLSIQSNS